jgi:hypothetical protein
MKNLKFFFAVGLLVIYNSIIAQQSEVLTNSSVLLMFTKNLPSSIILGKIKVAKNAFDTSTDSLVYLSNNKLPEELINAIIEAASDNSRHLIKVNPNNPMDMHDPGIYLLKKKENISELIQLETSIYSQNKTSGALSSALTYGLTKVKTSVTLDGSKAHFQLDNNQPEFYFYFDLSSNSLSETSNWWFSAGTSPNEFMLIKLDENKKTREVVTGSSNIGKTSTGVADKNKTVYKVDKVSQGIYKVSFDAPLPDGEYCFMYAGTVPKGFTIINKVYDFGMHLK